MTKFIPVTLKLLGMTATFLIPAANYIVFILGAVFCLFLNPLISKAIHYFMTGEKEDVPVACPQPA